ncbi:hypothetical protein RQP46_007879 [Phenoliferia psychrophenolica]
MVFTRFSWAATVLHAGLVAISSARTVPLNSDLVRRACVTTGTNAQYTDRGGGCNYCISGPSGQTSAFSPAHDSNTNSCSSTGATSCGSSTPDGSTTPVQYYLVGGAPITGAVGSATGTAGSTCVLPAKCPTGTFADKNGVAVGGFSCTPCTVYDAQAVTCSASMVTACAAKFYQSGSVNATTGVPRYETSVSQSCQPCGANALTCTCAGATSCGKDATGKQFYISSGACTASCLAGTYTDSKKNTCVKCTDMNASECSSATTSTTCCTKYGSNAGTCNSAGPTSCTGATYYLAASPATSPASGSCVSSCPSSRAYYSDLKNHVCTACTGGSATCDPNGTPTCPTGKFLQGGSTAASPSGVLAADCYSGVAGVFGAFGDKGMPPPVDYPTQTDGAACGIYTFFGALSFAQHALTHSNALLPVWLWGGGATIKRRTAEVARMRREMLDVILHMRVYGDLTDRPESCFRNRPREVTRSPVKVDLPPSTMPSTAGPVSSIQAKWIDSSAPVDLSYVSATRSSQTAVLFSESTKKVDGGSAGRTYRGETKRPRDDSADSTSLVFFDPKKRVRLLPWKPLCSCSSNHYVGTLLYTNYGYGNN